MDDSELFKILRKPATLIIMLNLYNHENGTTVSQLRKKIENHPGSISKYIDFLEEMNLVSSQRIQTNNPLNTRLISLTEKGKKFVRCFNEFQERCKEI